MKFKTLKKVCSLLTILTFLFSNTLYATPSSRSFFRNKKLDYQRLSTQNQQRLDRKKAIFVEGDKDRKNRQKQSQRILQGH